MAKKTITRTSKPKSEDAIRAEREAQRKAKDEADILLHEKLQALLDGDKDVESLRYVIETFYKGATEKGRVVPGRGAK